MAKLRGSGRDLAYIKEVTSGTTPATPAFTKMRTTGDSFNLTRDSLESAELRADRAITDLKLGNKQSGGSIDFELSYENFEPFLEAVLESADELGAVGSEIKNGITMIPYTIEKSWSASNIYQRYTGMYANTLNLNIASNSQITGSLEFIGKGFETGTDIITGATYAEPTLGGLFDSYNGVLKEGLGAGVVIGYVSSLSLTISNGLEALFSLFNDEVSDVIDGRCSIEGSLQIYFEDSTLFDKFVSDEESALEFTLTTGATTGYTVRLPRIKYTGGDMPVSGEGAVMVTMPFKALHDNITENATIKITKN